jgi:hypothetical protein
MREEIDVDVEVVRLLWVVENFFAHAGKRCHEIALYFLMQIPTGSKYLLEPGPFPGEEKEQQVKLIFQWFPLEPEVLGRLPLLPPFLQTALQRLPQSTQHFVQFNR